MDCLEMPRHVKAEQQSLLQTSENLFADIFRCSQKQTGNAALIRDIGRVASLALPQGWVKGTESLQDGGYSRSFHPEGNDQVQMVLSYRGHRLSDSASNAFRSLLDAGARVLEPGAVQKAPLNEVLGDIGHKKTFHVLSAKVQNINGESALVVEGKYANHDVNARFIYIDAEKGARGNGGAPVQEIALVAPTKEFYKAAITGTRQLEQIRWRP